MSETKALPSARPLRVLGVWDLIVYGVVLIQPIAPVGIFGLADRKSAGHVSATVLLAMVAMMLTAFSYGRLAAAFPSAGSGYTYVSRSFGSIPGFLIGWAMFLDYLIIPVINIIYAALTLERLIPGTPYVFWIVLLVSAMTWLNWRGVRSMARANDFLLAGMCVVIAIFVVMAARYVAAAAGWTALFSSRPFYNPSTFRLSEVMTATSLAALTYIGFDGVTMLAEEVRNPRRTVPLATVLVCLVTGVFSTVEVYLGQLVWPDYGSFPNLETAFMDVTRRAGGNLLFNAMGIILVVACFGSGLTGQAGAARLLYGMGRDDMLPRRWFGRLHPVRNVPTWNIGLIALLALAGGLAGTYQSAAELLNFGAFLAFLGVNLAAIHQFYLLRPHDRNLWTDLLAPAAGFLFCFAIWISLPTPAKAAGSVWLAAGALFLAWKTRGFRVKLAAIDFTES